jgi:hypothetical protein
VSYALAVTCSGCGRTTEFVARTGAAAYAASVRAGWSIDPDNVHVRRTDDECPCCLDESLLDDADLLEA